MKQQVEVRQLREGGYVVIDDEPCEILSISVSKPGKHGAAKARIDAIGIFDSQKRSIVQPVTAKIYVPIVERKRAQIISVTGNVAQLMDLETYETFELEVPEELKDKMEQGREVIYLESLGKRKIERMA
ncbi:MULTISPECIES: translation initiation factor IF-5A [Archaeoglobus]|jgi:translation initiation factor 5A|uniref:Translation initiation factor 5A n=3 Tax=Archaeoglobus fulgidus TaxID=2234 RepID=IF5A_ARCFU|nr:MULTISPECIES: translation initiation factor IF-5A [Archaeoglobus]O29612.1 RecName: Full=Translation initiation factor 5A; AltName: Full=Hypusine-containing protein; AltName: Full=eIF-5A [Archaeoglobus fulgidus DSM 4304]AAB90593.1 translation initiation factor eIF-5A (eif5A) [Archaeoglobus fulgidus DSM 4304]AIG97524.1 translation initiation factor eIF-5A [Archaeoglobus fulgidus DSM 8774]KUJ93447.1 MAG: Translation initiation factor 5A [Archaeoglobus fulgidus]KUK07076.1 MAG: Translation initi